MLFKLQKNKKTKNKKRKKKEKKRRRRKQRFPLHSMRLVLPDTKTRQTPQENYRSIFLMNIDATICNKTLAK